MAQKEKEPLTIKVKAGDQIRILKCPITWASLLSPHYPLGLTYPLTGKVMGAQIDAGGEDCPDHDDYVALAIKIGRTIYGFDQDGMEFEMLPPKTKKKTK